MHRKNVKLHIAHHLGIKREVTRTETSFYPLGIDFKKGILVEFFREAPYFSIQNFLSETIEFSLHHLPLSFRTS